LTQFLKTRATIDIKRTPARTNNITKASCLQDVSVMPNRTLAGIAKIDDTTAKIRQFLPIAGSLVAHIAID
jgi:hypothetical protein